MFFLFSLYIFQFPKKYIFPFLLNPKSPRDSCASPPPPDSASPPSKFPPVPRTAVLGVHRRRHHRPPPTPAPPRGALVPDGCRRAALHADPRRAGQATRHRAAE